MSKIIVKTLFVIVFCFGQTCSGSTITNTDFVGGTPSVTVPTGWTLSVGTGNLPISGLFDGVTANPGNGRVAFSQGPSASNLSDTNFISITIDLVSPFEITSLQIANDHGTNSSNEITSLTTVFTGGSVSPIVAVGLNDNIINDIDDVFSGVSISPVTSIEFRITGEESLAIELREFILEGNVVPEPAALGLTIFGLFSFGSVVQRLHWKK